MEYGDRIPEWNSTELISIAGIVLVGFGALLGIVMVLRGAAITARERFRFG